MAHTYTQIYHHIIFAVKGRLNLISPNWEVQLHKYITGVITSKNQKLMIINGMPDHIHLLIGMNPDCRLSDLVRNIKSNSSRWINERRFVRGKFEWQSGYSAFSVCQHHIRVVINYIEMQKSHHERKMFSEEFIELLKENEIDYRPEYLSYTQ